MFLSSRYVYSPLSRLPLRAFRPRTQPRNQPPSFRFPVMQFILMPIGQRNLNNAFAYDLVPAASVVAAALKAARRVNDFATAVRIFEGMFASTLMMDRLKQLLFQLASTYAHTHVSFAHTSKANLSLPLQASRPRSRTRASTSNIWLSSSPSGKSLASL